MTRLADLETRLRASGYNWSLQGYAGLAELETSAADALRLLGAVREAADGALTLLRNSSWSSDSLDNALIALREWEKDHE